jgi:REP element-mobilizing transposase RayT
MAQSLAKVYLHIVFSTKKRHPLIISKIEKELYAYIGGVIKNLKAIPININGMPDHIHILCTFPRTITIAKYLEEIKKCSSKWIKTKGDEFLSFAWQGEYSVFSVSESKVNAVSKYISNQKEHHKNMTFQEEVIQFLEKYGLEYDEKYLWD